MVTPLTGTVVVVNSIGWEMPDSMKNGGKGAKFVTSIASLNMSAMKTCSLPEFARVNVNVCSSRTLKSTMSRWQPGVTPPEDGPEEDDPTDDEPEPEPCDGITIEGADPDDTTITDDETSDDDPTDDETSDEALDSEGPLDIFALPLISSS